MWGLDHTHTGESLLLDNLFAKRLHPSPMNFRPEMVLGVIAVKEPDPIVKFMIAAHAPSHRFLRVAAIVPIVSVQIGKAVTEIPKREKETDVVPVKETEQNKVANEQC